MFLSAEPAAPRKVVIRYPLGPSGDGPSGAVFHMPTAPQAVGEIIRRLGVGAEQLDGQVIAAHGERLAVMIVHPEQPARLSRVGAFVLEGLTLIELQLGLAQWRDAKAEARA